MPTTITTTQLAALIQPFVGKRLSGDTTASLEIDAPGQRYGNADVRSLDDGHVEVFFYVGCDLIPLAAIRRIVIRSKDAEATYEHAGAREMAL